jgi:hypothetical protein
MNYESISSIVDDVIFEINDAFFLEEKVGTSDQSELLAVLDSMQLVSFLVEIEERIEEILKRHITLVDDINLLTSDGPLRTVGELKTFLSNKLL